MALDIQQTSTGSYVPTTFILDVAQLYSVDVTKPEFKELLVRLYQNINLMCNVLNLKDTGMYLTQELVNSQSWFQNPSLTSSTPQVPEYRQNYRYVMNFGPLPKMATTISQPHGLTFSDQVTFTRIYGTATDDAAIGTGNPAGLPIPYASATAIADQLELWIDDTNINIASGGTDYSAFNAVVVIEYLKL